MKTLIAIAIFLTACMCWFKSKSARKWSDNQYMKIDEETKLLWI